MFVLSRPHGTVVARGVAAGFSDVGAAQAALADGSASAVVGALPFDTADAPTLIAPESVAVTDTPLPGITPTPHGIVTESTHPSPDEHRRRVAEVVERIRRGDAEKVVLARSVDVRVTPRVEIGELLGALAGGNPEHNAFAVDLDRDGSRWLLGASPELLVRKRGREVTCHPYAGTAARGADSASDDAAAAALTASTKDRVEHAHVVDHLRDRLARWCTDVEAPTEPQLTATGELWHLATPIRATVRDEATTVLDLALDLGPTPAVGGTPRDAAVDIIAETEEPRRFYAGAVGWCDANGDGEWMVAIRCVEVAADREQLRMWAGGGLVAASDPDAELAETTAKLRTVRSALGITDV
nr:isochorismate synthase [Gordonia soli]